MKIEKFNSPNSNLSCHFKEEAIYYQLLSLM